MEQNLEQQLREAGIMEEELANMKLGEGESHSPSASAPTPPPTPAPPEAQVAAPAPTTGIAPPAPPADPPASPVPALVAQSLLLWVPPQSRGSPGHPNRVRKSIFHALLHYYIIITLQHTVGVRKNMAATCYQV